MSDYEKTKVWLAEMGITGYEERQIGESLRLDITCGCCDKVDGHPFFYTSLEFDSDGALLHMGAWE